MARGTLVLTVGVVVLGGVAAGSLVVSDTDYVHSLDATDATFNASEDGNLYYANLSERGQTVVDRTIERREYVVDDESETVAEFTYTTDHTNLGTGWYVIQRDGRTYAITTHRDTPGMLGGLLTLYVFTPLTLLGLALCVSGVLLRLRAIGD